MSAGTFALAGLTGGLEHLSIGKDHPQLALGFDYSGPIDPVEGDYFRGAAPLMPLAAGEAVQGAPMANSTMAVVDSSAQASLCILQRGGVYYVSLCDETLVWDSMYPMRGAFAIWLLSRTAGDKIVFDPYGDINGGSRPYELTCSAGLLSAIMKSHAETTVRLNSSLGGITALLALVSKGLQVGTLGGLVLSPIPHLMMTAYSAAYRPFLISLYENAAAKGLLLPEECQQLIEGTNLVSLSKAELVDRGAIAI